MKKGTIEEIFENRVVIYYDDNTLESFDRKLFPDNIKQDMIVEIENNIILNVKENDHSLKEKVEELTKKFKSFKERKNEKN